MRTLLTIFIVFATLKLAGLVAWSWWFVTAPLVVSFVVFSILAIFGVGALHGVEQSIHKRRRGW